MSEQILFPMLKTILNVNVTAEQVGQKYKITIHVPQYGDSCYWWEFDPQSAKNLFDCINEDKVFLLKEAKTPGFMRRMYHLIGLAVCRRIGLKA